MGITVVEDDNVTIIMALMDGIVHDVSVETLLPYANDGFPIEKLERYVRETTRLSQIPGVREYLNDLFSRLSSESTLNLAFATSVLGGPLAFGLTLALTPISEMSLVQLEALMVSWRDSKFAQKRKLFKLIQLLAVNTFVKLATDLHNEIIGYPGRDTRLLEEAGILEELVDRTTYKMKGKPTLEGSVLDISGLFEVLIVGSGSGAGVVAHTLAEAGHRSLVLEKGKYFKPEELQFNDREGGVLYENDGTITSKTQDMFILAGSTFGGGSTVNWSACLKTPFKVRKEWLDKHGVEWAASEHFEKCTDYVWNKMGATKENLDHSFTNRVILDGCHKLGYKVKEVEQNNGPHPAHNCGMCHLGCKHGIKQGSVSCWFKEAAKTGTEFMDQVLVTRILHKKGVQYGVQCRDLVTGVNFKIVGAKKIVVAGGSLNTPVVLQKSGFKNKHIGANLKLHPVTCLFGDFGHGMKTDPHNKPILTTVCTEVDDLDGKAHGAKIEAVLHAPYLSTAFLPWYSSDNARQNLLKYNQLASVLLIDRDTTSGTVAYDQDKPETVVVDYSINKYDKNALLQAMLISSDMLYVEGAKEILTPQPWTPDFKSSKPKSERSITDKDYVSWRKKAALIPLDNYGVAYGSAHQMSSCRISGKGPKHGAVDVKGRLFECKDIYVADASTMPTASGVNPMITTMAIARLISLGIVEELQPKPRL